MVDLDVGTDTVVRRLDQAAVHVEVQAIDEVVVIVGCGGLHDAAGEGDGRLELEAGFLAGEETQAIGLAGGSAEGEAGEQEEGGDAAGFHILSE